MKERNKRELYLKSDMVPQRSKVHALHFADLVVWLKNLSFIIDLKHL